MTDSRKIQTGNPQGAPHGGQGAPAMPPACVPVKHPYLALMGLYLGGFTGMYSETALNIALPQLSNAFGVDLALTQWLVVGYMLVIGLVLPFASLLMKWFPVKRIALFALGAFFVGSVMSACAPGFEIALAGRAIQGIGTGLVLPTMFSLVMEVIPPHRIGHAMGINALVIMSASAVGPTIAGLLIGFFSWRAVFGSFALVLLVAMFFTVRFIVSPYELTRPKIDLVSVLTSCLGFGGIVFGAGVASLYGWTSPLTLGMLAVGIVALVIYAYRQLHMDTPIIDLRVFKTQGFRVGILCATLNFCIALSTMYVLPQFYQNSLLLAVAFTGWLLLPGGIVNTVVSTLAGSIYDRIGARVPALLGFALSCLGSILMMFATPSTPIAYVMTCHIILMIGVPLAMSPCQTHALASLPHNLSTDGSTMINTMQQVFAAVCTALATYFVASGRLSYAAAGGTDTAMGFALGCHQVFVFSLIMAAVALVLATRLKKIPARGAAAAPAKTAASAGAEAASAAPAQNGLLAQLMRTPAFTLPENATALDALRLFKDKGISGAPVVDESGNLSGFVSDGDIIGSISRQNPSYPSFYTVVVDPEDAEFPDRLSALTHITVGELATRKVLSVQVGDDMRDVCTLLVNHHLKKAPVLDHGKIVGVINRSNITGYAVERYAEEEK